LEEKKLPTLEFGSGIHQGDAINVAARVKGKEEPIVTYFVEELKQT